MKLEKACPAILLLAVILPASTLAAERRTTPERPRIRQILSTWSGLLAVVWESGRAGLDPDGSPAPAPPTGSTTSATASPAPRVVRALTP